MTHTYERIRAWVYGGLTPAELVAAFEASGSARLAQWVEDRACGATLPEGVVEGTVEEDRLFEALETARKTLMDELRQARVLPPAPGQWSSPEVAQVWAELWGAKQVLEVARDVRPGLEGGSVRKQIVAHKLRWYDPNLSNDSTSGKESPEQELFLARAHAALPEIAGMINLRRKTLADGGKLPYAPEYLTREDAPRREEWPGVVKALSVKLHARLRHHSRVDATIQAVAYWVSGRADVRLGSDLWRLSPEQRRACVALLALDLHGAGGKCGYRGGTTQRMRWAERLGSARWKATDGAAWEAATSAALCLFGAAEDGRVATSSVTPEEVTALARDVLVPSERRWAICYALHALEGVLEQEEEEDGALLRAWSEAFSVCAALELDTEGTTLVRQYSGE